MTKSGKRYVVYYRRGGRAFPLEYAGSFPKLALAQTRRDLIAGELAAGRDPRVKLAALKTPPVAARGLAALWKAYEQSRVDVSEDTREGYRDAGKRWLPILGTSRHPATVTVADVIAGIAELRDDVSAATVGQYLSTLRLVLDFADVDPNPARSAKVRRPRAATPEKEIPTNAAWAGVRDQLRKRSLLIERLQEACAFRVSEAAALEWGDIDFVEGAARIRREGTKSAAGRRWVPIPPELLDAIADLTPLEDRRTRGRILGVRSTKTVRYDLDKACVAAGAPVFSTHALRHRRISLWLRHGIDPVQVKTWAGHAQAAMSLNIYGHVVLEPAGDEWRDFWLATYQAARRAPREAPVGPEEAENAD